MVAIILIENVFMIMMALGGKDVMGTKMLIEDVLMLIEDCRGAKQTNKHKELDCSCNQHKHKIGRYIDTYSLIVAVVVLSLADPLLSWSVGSHGRKPRRLVCLAPVYYYQKYVC